MRHYQRFCGSLAFVLAALGEYATPVSAAEFRAEGSIVELFSGNQFAVDSYARVLAVQAGGGVSYNFIPGVHGQADSLASGLGLRAHAFSQIIGDVAQYELISQSRAAATFTDMVISGPAGGLVSTSINFDLTGATIVGSSAGGGVLVGFADASVVVMVFVNGVKVGDGFHYDRFDTRSGKQSQSSGMLAGWGTATSGISTPAFDVQPGVPFTLKLELQAAADAAGSGTGVSSAANSDFGHTLTFSLTGPVFNLPSGYTAASADAQIVANQVVSVPEPSAFAILSVAAFMALAFKRRR